MGLHCALKDTRLCWPPLIWLAFAPFLSAQSHGDCDSGIPQSPRAAELQRSLHAHPSVAAYDALGSLYAHNQRGYCAESAFRAALRLEPGSAEARYDLALALRLERKASEAKVELQALLQAHPEFALARVALGQISAEEENYDEATRNFEAALRLDQRLTAASEGLVQASLASRRPEAAAYWAERALTYNPPEPVAYRLRLNLGIAQGQAGDYDNAEKNLTALVASFPDKVDPHVNLGIIKVHLQLYTAAIKEFSRALQLDGGRNEVRLALAQADLLANRPQDALSVALAYNSHAPRDAEGRSTLGRAYLALNECAEAIPEFRRSLDVRSSDYETLFDLGTCQIRTGATVDALASFRRAEHTQPSNPAVHYQIFRLLNADKSQDSLREAQSELAEFKRLSQKEDQNAKVQVMGLEANGILDKGDPAKAAELYRKVLQANPKDASNHFNLSLALARLNDSEGEIRELHTAIALDPKMSKAHNRLGLCEEEQGHLRGAAKEFETVLEDEPASTEAKINLATVYGKAGQLTRAESLLREVINEHPDSLPGQLNLGLVLSSEKRWQDALVPLQAAAELEPKNPQPLTLLGIIYGKMGDSPQSIEYLRKALDLAPDSASAHLNLGIALADGLDLHAASQEFAAAEKLAPNNASVHYNAGRLAFDQGDETKARTELQQACALQNDYPGALQLLGQLELHNGQVDAAVEHLSRVTALQPQNADAAYLLGRAFADEERKQQAISEWQRGLRLSSDDPRLLWALAHELPTSDPHRAEYLAKLKLIKGSERNTDLAKTLANLGIIAAGNHEWTDAVAKMSEAIETCNHCAIEASLQQNLGLIYAQRGQLREAEEALKRSVQIDPSIPRGKEELAVVEKLQAHPSMH